VVLYPLQAEGNAVPIKRTVQQASVPASPTLYERIYACIAQVPPGYVTTYGTVGRIVGCPARVVGYALHFLKGQARPDVPWQRVINARGGISTYGNEQRRLLEAEGVTFGAEERVDLERFGWRFTCLD
jgi:methylated-DNA-protein-cysteine methyltransferase-like protein